MLENQLLLWRWMHWEKELDISPVFLSQTVPQDNEIKESLFFYRRILAKNENWMTESDYDYFVTPRHEVMNLSHNHLCR